jgi:cytochrome c biogenesis factor
VVDAGSVITFIIVSFSLALVLIMKRDSLPSQIKRPMALIAIVLISFAFFLLVYSFFQMK